MSRRRCRPASRCGSGPTPWPITHRPSCALAGRVTFGHDGRARRPARRPSRASSTAAIQRHADERGSFRELWRDEALPRASGSSRPTSRPRPQGVLRGLHLHRRQTDLWIVAQGRAQVALVDVRPLLGRTGPTALVETRELGEDEWVVIPTGVAHGFLALEPLQLIYFVTNLYDGTDELGFAWDDPAVGVPWAAVEGTPDGRPILSGRDTSNPSLRELVDGLAGPEA